MKFLSCLLLFLSIASINAQNSFNKTEATEIIDTFFKGFHEKDTLLIKSVIVSNLPIQTALTENKGTHRVVEGNIHSFLRTIASRPKDQVWEEKLLSYEVKLDGNIAHVWTPYEFWLNGKFSHCGANAFTLGKTEEGWKIIHLIDSRRREGCNH